MITPLRGLERIRAIRFLMPLIPPSGRGRGGNGWRGGRGAGRGAGRGRGRGRGNAAADDDDHAAGPAMNDDDMLGSPQYQPITTNVARSSFSLQSTSSHLSPS